MPNAPRRSPEEAATPEPGPAPSASWPAGPLDPVGRAWLVAFGLMVLGAFVGMLFLHYRNPATVPVSGLGFFAPLYVLAQAIERIVEATNHFLALGGDTTAQPETRPRRVVICFGLASALAMLACGYFGLGVVHAIGDTGVPRYIDVIVTGMAIGGGTKPLHDFITCLDGWARRAKAPPGGRSASANR